jgi:hypothetical protein
LHKFRGRCRSESREDSDEGSGGEDGFHVDLKYDE